MYSMRFSCASKFLKIKNLTSLEKLSIRHNHQIKEALLSYGENVAAAKEKGLPIVALESTIITHGMPYPDNLDTALEVEHIIRQKGVTPATIAVLDGKIKVGADKNEIEKLAKCKGENFIKISRRDFSYALSKGLNGGTTVSGTMLVAKMAGIPIMATGGIGGVHRQVELSMDISADLKELGQTSVAVVCSGVKAILDIPKTLEFLESQGVPVVKIGSSDLFPAFYSRETSEGLRSPMRVSDAEEASRLIAEQMKLGLETGILFAVPVPEPFSLDPHEIEAVIKKALEAANRKNISGKNVTPFLLEELTKLTSGRSLSTNKALIKNNAGVAADIALHLAKLENITMSSGSCSDTSKVKGNPVVIGGATFDTILRVKDPEIKMNGSTHRGESRQSCGGVGRNLTEALMNLDMTNTKLLSVIGNDQAGKAIIDSLGTAASTVSTLSNLGTARYTAIVDSKGNCCFGISEMEAFSKINYQYIEKNMELLKNTSFIVMDGNLPLDAMGLVLDISKENQIPVWYEPTDLQKALKIFQCSEQWKKILYFISPNVNELMAMAKHFQLLDEIPKDSEVDLEIIKRITERLVEKIPVVIATLGVKGVLVSRKASENEPFLDKHNNLIETSEVQSHLYPILNTNGKIASVSGCGDCLAAGIIAGIIRGWKELNCISLGLHAANLSLVSFKTVPNTLKSLPKIQESYAPRSKDVENKKISNLAC